MKKYKYVISLSLFLLFIFSAEAIRAGTLQTVSDTITISEPGKESLHTILFKNQTQIPLGGEIIIQFPRLASGDANDEASPSASTFQLNGISEDQIKIAVDGSDISSKISVQTDNPSENTSPTVTITLDSATINAGAEVKIFLGCEKVLSGICSSPSPMILNPTKTKAQGQADRWSITLITKNSAGVTLDSGNTRIATIEPVRTAAQIDPVLIFSISGIGDSENVNSGNEGCQNTTNTNTGEASKANSVNLGNLSEARINVSAQFIKITTNVFSGYTLVASSSGKLSSGTYDIRSSTEPSQIVAGSTFFGIRPCGIDTNESIWGANCLNEADSANPAAQ